MSNLLLRNIFFVSITLLASAAPFGKAQAQAKPLFNVEPGSEYSGSVWGVEVGGRHRIELKIFSNSIKNDGFNGTKFLQNY